VVVDDLEHQNLLGLLMKELLAANLADDAIHARVKNLKGDIQVGASDMVITMRFSGGQLTLLSGPSDNPRARVSGDMSALLGVCSGAGLVAPVLSGAIKIGGNPFLLLKILPLIKQPSDDATQ
jgi:hypothetical protein